MLPNKNTLKILGPPTEPFGRKKGSIRNVLNGEDILFTDHIQVIRNKSELRRFLKVIPKIEYNGQLSCLEPVKKYLWVIDHEGIKFINSKVKNLHADRGVVCHTNITGGAIAHQGGEIWFGINNDAYLNHFSGRFDEPSELQMNEIIKLLKNVSK